jgi:dTDP-4-amino-4,6-dideoxygalactose transaminase
MKREVEELAIFGGAPLFTDKLHVGRPNVGDRDAFLRRMQQVLDNRWFTNNGPLVQEFERRVSDLTGAEHCIAICNATVALEIAIRALDLMGEVIVPSFTFIATAHALQWQQITPVFCDIGPNGHNIDPHRVEELITPRTSGIIGVHLWGEPCDVEALQELAERNRLKLLFDAAHAFGCAHNGRMIGNFGAAEVFSFHATKFMNSFEGGMIATNDAALAHRIRLMTNFGFEGFDNVVYIGTNGKMTEASAAMGLTNLEAMEGFVTRNRENHDTYSAALAGIAGVHILPVCGRDRRNYQYVVLEIDADELGLDRDELLQILWAENVLARRYFYPGCHRMQPYRDRFPHAHFLLPRTEALTGRILVMPTGTAVDTAAVEQICAVVRLVAGNAGSIRRRVAALTPRITRSLTAGILPPPMPAP